MSALTSYLHGEVIEPDDRVEMNVPGDPRKTGRFSHVSHRGLIVVQPWSPRLGRYTTAFIYYAPSFVRRLGESP